MASWTEATGPCLGQLVIARCQLSPPVNWKRGHGRSRSNPSRETEKRESNCTFRSGSFLCVFEKLKGQNFWIFFPFPACISKCKYYFYFNMHKYKSSWSKFCEFETSLWVMNVSMFESFFSVVISETCHIVQFITFGLQQLCSYHKNIMLSVMLNA